MAGVSRLQYSPEIRLIRVMCSGRVDLAFVLKAFHKGVDGVFIGGCRLGECNYSTQGNYYALNMVHLCKKLMQHIGLDPERLRIEFMTSADGIRFARVVTDFIKKIRDLGPIGEGEGLEKDELRKKLEELIKLVPYIKLVKKDKMAQQLDNIEQYKDLYTDEEINDLLTNVVSYYIDPEKCQACGICRRRCPADAIDGEKNKIHIIDQEKCIKCGTCFEVCPSRFSAVRKIVGEPVPPSIPEDQRIIVRKAKKAG